MPFLTGPAAVRIAPFAIYILFLALDAPLSNWVAALGLDIRWLYACRAGFAGLLMAAFWRSYAELASPTNIPQRMWVTSVMTGLLVFVLWIMPYPEWAMIGGPGTGFDPSRPDGGIDYLLVAVRIAGAALVVPLMEELFWRAFLMRWIDSVDFLSVKPAAITMRALSISAVLFAVEHSLWLAGLLAGLAYGWLYIISRNLWMPVLAHAVTNASLGFWVVHTGAWRYW